MRTRVVLVIEHPDNLGNITKEDIEQTFDDLGDVAWAVEVQEIEREEPIS